MRRPPRSPPRVVRDSRKVAGPAVAAGDPASPAPAAAAPRCPGQGGSSRRSGPVRSGLQRRALAPGEDRGGWRWARRVILGTAKVWRAPAGCAALGVLAPRSGVGWGGVGWPLLARPGRRRGRLRLWGARCGPQREAQGQPLAGGCGAGGRAGCPGRERLRAGRAPTRAPGRGPRGLRGVGCVQRAALARSRCAGEGMRFPKGRCALRGVVLPRLFVFLLFLCRINNKHQPEVPRRLLMSGSENTV